MDDIDRACETEARASATECAGCLCQIPDARREAVPGVQLCVACQSAAEHRARQRHHR
ncbi:MAG: TraR/DksA C4-type zinc finger protein [Zoogloea sp.]|uniref:TraR/DksA C4-type zinc finger protein n=1 Tax=Zoogloea sp. TaxID=49181 RepID=UPI00261FBF98|nr:TraR/DksA C4-type zinc finger protein [Zoogloea sp.]MDD3328873.1 TraR/DksA C4-type zinc finger protein [Zoogloea sp.]